MKFLIQFLSSKFKCTYTHILLNPLIFLKNFNHTNIDQFDRQNELSKLSVSKSIKIDIILTDQRERESRTLKFTTF